MMRVGVVDVYSLSNYHSVCYISIALTILYNGDFRGSNVLYLVNFNNPKLNLNLNLNPVSRFK